MGAVYGEARRVAPPSLQQTPLAPTRTEKRLPEAAMSAQGELIVSVSGVRGVVGEGLTPQVALAFAGALGAHVSGGSVVVGRDGRPSGSVLRHAVLAGLAAAGCEVHDLGVAATPTVGLAARTLQAAGGIQITASHNPAPWNGLKLFGPD